ncbi:Jag family protein [Bifidobacterium apicola]|uniref:Jag family protein n=1 Tax=Bifidobacterium apicola TaxID=3230739 RepID=UPI0036F1DE26
MSQSLDQGKTIEQLNEEADVAADYLEGLLDIADYEGDIEMGVRNHRPTVQIVADDDTDIKHLIGKDGEVVDALQQLTRLAVQQKIGERSHLIVDVDGFLRRKREHLREQALDVIDEVRETGDPVNMKPMNSFERKIVHDMVREEGLKSRSHGEEPHRYVTVYLKAKSEDEDLPDDVEDVPVGYDARLDVDETSQVDDSTDYAADDDSEDADRE